MSHRDSIEQEAERNLTAPSEGRRRNMQANRRRDTGPELALRSALHRLGYRYRCDLRIDLAGGRVRPDIVFTKKKIAVFVDGCFWHGCPEHGRRPTINPQYWNPKIEGNINRDRRHSDMLVESGWKVIRIWEHEDIDVALDKVIAGMQTPDNTK